MYYSILLLAALLLLLSIAGGGEAAYGLDTVLSQAFKSDPLAINDTFHLLKPGTKRALSHPRPNVAAKLEALSLLHTTTLVTVRLAGFSTDQRRQLEAQLSRYLDVLNKNDAVHVIGGDAHRLGVRSRIEVEVASASSGLADSVFRAVESRFDSSSSSSSGPTYHQAIPFTAVDDIVRVDLEQHPVTSYVFYILNPRRQPSKYGYDYSTPAEGSNGRYSFTRCLGNYWTGRERYLWLDLAAGPIEYGPALSVEGLIVREDTFPAAAAAWLGESDKAALLADMASMVWSASVMLFAPAIRTPVFYEAETEVHLYHIRQTSGDEASLTAAAAAGGIAADSGVNWTMVEDSFKQELDALLLPGQSMSFRRFEVDMASCASCSAAVAESTKTYTSRVLLDRYSLFVNEYLDSRLLHQRLSAGAAAEVQQLAKSDGSGGSGAAKSEEWRPLRVVPVYVFDLGVTERVMLLDRHEQAVAFPDMVVAARSRGFSALSDFSCNSRPMVTEAQRVERPLVAALLQTVWGVSPSHLTWSEQRNATLLDYTWSLARTPFGPFGSGAGLSFAQRDAAPRNTLLLMLNNTLWQLRHILEAVQSVPPPLLLGSAGGAASTEAAQRWNLLLYKLHKSTAALSHFDFHRAYFLLRSAEHDVYALHSALYAASAALQPVVSCFHPRPLPWALLFVVLTACLATSYMFWRRERLFVSKRKRF